MAYLRDYSGSGYPQSRTVDIAADNIRSFRCVDCKRLTYFPKQQADRVGRAYCPKCGGTLAETRPSASRRMGGLSERELDRIDDQRDLYKDYACRFCAKRFRNPAALTLHYRDAHGFRDEFGDAQK